MTNELNRQLTNKFQKKKKKFNMFGHYGNTNLKLHFSRLGKRITTVKDAGKRDTFVTGGSINQHSQNGN